MKLALVLHAINILSWERNTPNY